MVGTRPAAGLLAVAALLLLAAAPRAAAQNNVAAEDGLFVSVPSPVTSAAVTQIDNRLKEARNAPRPVRKVVFDFNPDDRDAATAEFGPCYDLARLIAGMHDLTTIAFVRAKVSGHAVLPVLACKELAMGRQKAAALGEVSDGRPLPGLEKAAYPDVLGANRAAALAAVQKMFDPAVDLGKGLNVKQNNAVWFVDRRRTAAELKADGVVGVEPVAFVPAGRVGLYTADQAKLLGLCKVTADTREELADLYGIAPGGLRDPLQGRDPVVFRYAVAGEVTAGTREAVNRVIKDVKRQKGNTLFLELQCGGGDLQAARGLADDLVKHATGDDAVRVIGVVFDQAPDTATFVALGCSEIVMSRRKDAADPDRPEDAREAEIGDFEAVLGKPGKKDGGNPDLHRQSLRQLAESQGYPGILADGMFQKDLEIVRARGTTDRTRRRLMSRADFDAEKAAGGWQDEGTIKRPGQLLKLNATVAKELGVARHLVDNRDMAAVYAAYGLEQVRVREATPGWLDRFAEFLRYPAVTILLVLVGFTGLILELKMPGLTVPGIMAALCFILVFWSHSQFSGQQAILAGLIFLLGLVLVLLEVFVLPGFGAPGIFGVMCMLAALALVTMEKVPQTWDEAGDLGGKVGQYLGAMIGSTVLAFVVARFLPNIPYANRLMLAAPADAPDADEPVLPGAGEAAALLGAVGTANTALRPAGVVRFDDKFVDVVSEGGYIPAGARVQVVEVESTRIVVKEV